ncbi:porin family protein [Shewanella holmiensis]|uniref:Porin family protein n=1 Tax=Shewanella holmiensis TaxID=2952222 RepID=A0A9X2WLK8_9GAMM|nr:porin family protein [Shewanella holmiensis]MCT7941429.1 porin family protein [Shewanella holmiensis]
MNKILGITLASLLLCNGAIAEESEPLLFKSVEKDVNVFERYGLSPEIPKIAMNSMIQGENLVEHAIRVTEYDGEIKSSEIFLVQSVDEKNNIDLRIKYDPAKLDQDEDVIARIEDLTKSEYLLRQYAESLDRSTLKVAEKANGEVEIRFNYSKYQLPQNIAYFRFMKVALTAKDGKAIKMVISNNQSFELNDIIVSDYSQTTDFGYLDNGNHYVKEKVEKIIGRKKSKPITVTTTTKTIALYDKKNTVEVIDADLLAQVSDPRIHEEKVDLNRPLPLMADLVRRQGIDVPLPYGFSIAMRKQDMDVPFTSFNIMGINLDEFFDPKTTSGSVTAESATLRADVNILPFWNVYALYGKIKVDAVVNADYTGNIRNVFVERWGEFKADLVCGIAEKAGLPICAPAEFDVPLDLDYDVVGVGTTLSVGYREFFASVNTTYAATKLSGQDWGDGIITVQPMLGYQFVDYRAQLFLGAEYQGLDATMSGNLGKIDGLDQDFTYDVGVELNQWAYLIGFNKQIGKNYNITALYSKGETRDSYTLNFGYRF